jgi:hypothetical protein
VLSNVQQLLTPDMLVLVFVKMRMTVAMVMIVSVVMLTIMIMFMRMLMGVVMLMSVSMSMRVFMSPGRVGIDRVAVGIDHAQQQPADALTLDPLGDDFERVLNPRVSQGSADLGQVGPQVQQRCKEHIAGDPAEGVDVKVSRHGAIIAGEPATPATLPSADAAGEGYLEIQAAADRSAAPVCPLKSVAALRSAPA